jgi:hypothetical protein
MDTSMAQTNGDIRTPPAEPINELPTSAPPDFLLKCRDIMQDLMEGARVSDAIIGTPLVTTSAGFGVVWRNSFKLPDDPYPTRVVCWQTPEGLRVAVFA